jgi:NAD(P)-dependent dehydrogenase (short-subunit alcohol dehydrogenase family)
LRSWPAARTIWTEIDQAGGTALVVEADITDRTQAEAAVQQAVERFGRLDPLPGRDERIPSD